MTRNFDYFIVFAEMRTGSNFLESNLNAMDGVACYGEAFNSHFIGYPNKTEILGVSLTERDADPGRLISMIKDQPGQIGGFRFFNDHDRRVLDIALPDPRCAKIILTRNPLDSYVSWKIARETDQWKLTNIKRRREAAVRFQADEFTRHVDSLQEFQILLLNRLQTSGQTAFYIAYEDLQSLEVMNGLADWLGAEGQLGELDQSLKRQNPSPVTSKVSNPDEMEEALSGLDRFNLTRTPNFEPRRGPAVPSYVLGAQTPLMYLPVRNGPEQQIIDWLARLDGVDPDALLSGLNQKSVRKWMRRQGQHRRFTVIRHPLLRAHSAFCRRILNPGPGAYPKIRETLRRRFKLPIPKDAPDEDYSRADHRMAFEAFLEFVKTNLAGQTPIRVDASWCSQAHAIASFCDFLPPDHILREDELPTELPRLAAQFGTSEASPPDPALDDTPYSLAEIYDDTLETLATEIYQRDYLMYGFGAWRITDAE